MPTVKDSVAKTPPTVTDNVYVRVPTTRISFAESSVNA